MRSAFPEGLFFLRHCRTEYNATQRISGQADIPIADSSIDTTALEQSIAQKRDIKIVASPLIRCVQTVSILLAQTGLNNISVDIDSRIAERRMGCWEGEYKDAVFRDNPDYCCDGHFNPLKTPPGGEAIEDFLFRIDDFVGELLSITENRPILICAHNQSLKLILFRLTQKSDLLEFWHSHSFKNGKVERIY